VLLSIMLVYFDCVRVIHLLYTKTYASLWVSVLFTHCYKHATVLVMLRESLLKIIGYTILDFNYLMCAT
jgi:hypothetical protein